MKQPFKIIVEGIADQCFLIYYLKHLYACDISSEDVIKCGGWTTLNSLKLEGEEIRQALRKNSDNGGVNLIIFDADTDIEQRRNEIKTWGSVHDLNFELFLLPDNETQGALEELLEQIINPVNQPIFDCWQMYEENLLKQEIPGRTPPPLTIPAKKTKIYGYLEVLLGNSSKEKERIKENKRDYSKTEHWNLNSEVLRNLKEFLDRNLLSQ